jgi:hypothetical protein
MASSRRYGAEQRGSSLRASSASRLVTEIATRARRFAAAGATRSMSRSIRAFFVMSVNGCSHSARTSMTERVMRSSRSAGWYASVLTPIAIGLQR